MAAHKVLVVDDDKGILKLISAMLRRGGYEPLTANNGEDALACHAAEQPDIVLLDLLMPEMNGYDVLVSMRERDAALQHHTLILMLSAHTQHSFPFEPPSNGHAPDGWITKPVTAVRLLQELAAHRDAGA